MASRTKKQRDSKPAKVVDQVKIERVNSQPSVRVSTNWTPARVRQIQASADNGNMQPVADLVDQIIVDDRFSQCLQSLCDSVLGAELKWQKGLRDKSRDSVALAREIDDDWWTAYAEAEYSQIVRWREMLGFAWGRQHWLVSPTTGRFVPVLTFWHPRHFRYDNQYKQWFVRLDDSGLEEAVTPGDGEWCIFYRAGEARPWANGLWRGLSRWWMLKAYAISDWGVHSEKAARQVITAAEGVSAADRKALAADLYVTSKDGIISLPKDFEYKLVEATANTRDIYDAQIAASNDAGTIAILGQNLTTEISDNGSRAASETHERKEARKVRYVAESLSTSVREQTLIYWARYNFGDTASPPWPVWQVALPEDTVQQATTLSTLADAISKLKSAGKGLPAEYLKDKFGLELDEVEPTEQPQQGAPQKPGTKPTKPGDKAAPRKQPSNVHQHPVRAGRTPVGFIDTQLYGDDVADATADHAGTELESFVDKLLGAIGDANDYDSIREAVHRAYEAETEPERLADLVEHAIIMAHLGGRLGTHEDISE